MNDTHSDKTDYCNPRRLGLTSMEGRGHTPDGFRKLSIGDEEGGDLPLVEQPDQCIDLRIHDRLSHEGQGTVFGLLAVGQSLW